VNHTVRRGRADWADIPQASRTRWQQVAATTHGLVTPGNAVTVLGLVLSLVGVWYIYNDALAPGLALLAVGRLADMADGLVADNTHTKSPVGELLDAGCDKLVAGVVLIAFLAGHIIPLLPLVVLLAQTVINIASSIVARRRGRELHPSTLGKRAAVVEWLVVFWFLLARLIAPHSVFLADVCNVIGYASLLVFIIWGADASIGYARHALRAKPAKKYTDDTGQLHSVAGRLLAAWRRRTWLVIVSIVLAVIILFAAYCLAASPYSSDSFVETPFTTQYEGGQIVLTQHFTPRVYSGWFASTIGYLEQTVTDLWMRLRSPKEPAGGLQSITAAIHAQRFDPTKPYVISGDQFQGLYLRNLGVFYQDLLNRDTALNTADWHNRERIAVQSLAYGLSATQQLGYPVTTLLPISQRGVIAVNFWSYPSDTMFGLLNMLAQLKANPETRQAAMQLQREYGSGLRASYQNYLATVRDPKTGLVRTGIHISSARDAVQRESSFYDNVILWRTEQLAAQLGVAHVSGTALASLHQTIMNRYWDAVAGHFIDGVAPYEKGSYSSDWLIALPTGFLNPANPADLAKLERISAYIDKEHLTSPLPIRYTADSSTAHQDFFVHYFVGSYGNTAIWSYWGDLYIQMQADLYARTSQVLYAQHAETALASWQQVITRDRGYPETLNANGKLLITPVYESIRRNGWIVDFETARYNWNQVAKGIIR
jgi:phosphatidylglycerophosphate synthase